MCFFTKQTKKATEIEFRFNAKFTEPDRFSPADLINGFTFPETPVIISEDPGIIQFLNWGLIPEGSVDDTIRKFTLNARIETLDEKPSFREYISNRCLIIANGFYEWQWLDKKGDQKQKYELTLPKEQLFSFAGIWSAWKDPSGNQKFTYSLLTTKANRLMSEIHNTKKRMPVILSADQEKSWLNNADIDEFRNIDPPLIARKIETKNNKTQQPKLF
jgi:putative SOS response-associated peptidase YedK